MNANIVKIAKVVIPLASLAANLGMSWLKDKELDAKIALSVKEALSKQAKES